MGKRRRSGSELDPGYRQALEELDSAYFEGVSRLVGSKKPGDEEKTKQELDVIDKQYQSILPQLLEITATVERSIESPRYTIQEVRTNQDCIQASALDNNFFWIHADVAPRPVPPKRNPSLEVESGEGSTVDSPDEIWRVDREKGKLSDLIDNESFTCDFQLFPESGSGNRSQASPDQSTSLRRQSQGFDAQNYDLSMHSSTTAKDSFADSPTTSDARIKEIRGNLLDAPDCAILVHAVNCQGVWGFGVARHLKEEFPAAFDVYQSFCNQEEDKASLIGSCLLIPPQKRDYTQQQCHPSYQADEGATASTSLTLKLGIKPRRFIACLFTSIGYGRRNKRLNNPGRDSSLDILKHTIVALRSLRGQVEEPSVSDGNPKENFSNEKVAPGEIWCCRFNSGAFGVPWEMTKRLLQDEFIGSGRAITVAVPDHEAQEDEA